MDKKTPRALLKLGIGARKWTVESRREFDASRTTMKHLSSISSHLIYQKWKQYLAVSLPGAGPSKRVTEGYKGWLTPDGNRSVRVYA